MRSLLTSKMYVALLLVAAMFCSNSIIAQSSWGIGSEFHTSRLTPMKLLQTSYTIKKENGVLILVESDNYHKVDFKHDFSVSPVFYYKWQFRNNLAFESGLGYSAIRYRLLYEREVNFSNQTIWYSSFHMALQYLYVPIKFQYRIPTSNINSLRQSWCIAAGLRNRVLVAYDHNSSDLTNSDDMLNGRNWFSRFVTSAELSFGYVFNLKGNQNLELYMFYNFDISPFTRKLFLYSEMRSMKMGLGFKYFM